MSILSIRRALGSGLNGISPALHTAWQNLKHVPISGVPYQQVYIKFANPDNTEFNGAHYRELGYMQVNLMYPLEIGTNDINNRAILIRSTFERGNTFIKDGVTVVIFRTPEVADGFVDGDRFRITVRIPFYTNYT